MTTISKQLSPPATGATTASSRPVTLMHRVLATSPVSAPLVARLTLAVVLFPHGAQHALGWFGGYGFSGTFGWMTQTLGFPAVLSALAIFSELLAPIALAIGIGGRLASTVIFCFMVGAASTHLKHGFFMSHLSGSVPEVALWWRNDKE